MSNSSEAVGSLLIDLRANVAQLQTDMGAVKDIINKSSREMSSQMKHDMQETRQILGLMRDDFGVGIPRELRKVIASSELARTAIMGIQKALFGIAFINLGVEAFQKIAEWIGEAKKHAEEEAKHTREIAEAAFKSVEATTQRAEKLALIGKGEEERAALQKKFFDEELARNKSRLLSLQNEINAKVLLMNIEAERSANPDIYDPGTGMYVGKGTDQAAGDKVRAEGLKAINESSKDIAKQIAETQKAIDDAIAGTKTNDLALADFERGLGISRLKNSEEIALKDVEIKKDTIERMYAAGKIGLEQELMALRLAATERHNIAIQTLESELAILEQDPSRNKEKIEQDHTKVTLENKNYQKTLTDIYYQGVADRKKLADEEHAMNAAVMQGLAEMEKMIRAQGTLPIADIIGTMQGGAPQLKVDMVGAAVDRMKSNFKDAAVQGKFLEQAMQAMLKPADEYRIIQGEIDILLAKPEFRNSPEVIKALHAELLRANPEFQKLMQASADFGKSLANELDNLILKGGSFHDFLVNIAKDIEEIALKAALLKPLEDFFSGGKSGTGGIFGFLGSLFGSLGGSAGSAGSAGASVGSLTGLGVFAKGGDPPVGLPSMVGELGPELFVPHTAGTIIPNNALGGGVTNIFNIDAKGAAAGSEQAIMRGIQRALEQNVQRSVAAAADYQRRR